MGVIIEQTMHYDAVADVRRVVRRIVFLLT